MKGLFITFEGPDGAGKSTQIKMLKQWFEMNGMEVVMTREPGGTRISDQIRTILLAPEHTEMADRAEVLLYAASRAQHIHERILPALEQGKIVLCDRFIDASIAYQAYGLGVDLEQVRSINAFAARSIDPVRTYMIDIPPEISRDRIARRTQNNGQSAQDAPQELDRIEQKQLDYHRKVREGFLTIAKQDWQRVCLVDGNRSIEEVFETIKTDCRQLLSRQSKI